MNEKISKDKIIDTFNSNDFNNKEEAKSETNLTMEINNMIQETSKILGKEINRSKYKIIDRGIPHEPKSLPKNTMGVYIFLYKGKFLKIGKAGPNSNARFLSQHYNQNSAKSTLAKSILSDKRMENLGINELNVGTWIKNNCRRIDIILDKDLGIFALELVEATLHYKYEPVYEGYENQR